MVLQRDRILVVGGEDLVTQQVLDDVLVRVCRRSRRAMHEGCRSQQGRYSLMLALASETLKRVDSADPAQREFDAEALAPAAGGPGDFEAAKRWIDRAKVELFAAARQTAIEQHFRAAGHAHALRVPLKKEGRRLLRE